MLHTWYLTVSIPVPTVCNLVGDIGRYTEKAVTKGCGSCYHGWEPTRMAYPETVMITKLNTKDEKTFSRQRWGEDSPIRA